jgi:hypothetical protein
MFGHRSSRSSVHFHFRIGEYPYTSSQPPLSGVVILVATKGIGMGDVAGKSCSSPEFRFFAVVVPGFPWLVQARGGYSLSALCHPLSLSASCRYLQ